MKRILIIVPILSLMMAACTPDPYADAYFKPTDPWVGEDITFTNLSTNTSYSEWDMGDGSTSSAFNVIHYYNDPGYYDVTLRSFGKKGGVSMVNFEVEVIGSELKVIVEDIEDGWLIEGAEVTLFYTLDAWNALDFNLATETLFTNRYGECVFSGLSNRKYYVDVYYRVGNEGWVNELLGVEDPVRWIETQTLPGGWDHTFVAYVDAVVFEDQKKSTGRPTERVSPDVLKRKSEKSPRDMPVQENKTSIQKER